jgi:hypothetical protein
MILVNTWPASICSQHIFLQRSCHYSSIRKRIGSAPDVVPARLGSFLASRELKWVPRAKASRDRHRSRHLFFLSIITNPSTTNFKMKIIEIPRASENCRQIIKICWISGLGAKLWRLLLTRAILRGRAACIHTFRASLILKLL